MTGKMHVQYCPSVQYKGKGDKRDCGSKPNLWVGEDRILEKKNDEFRVKNITGHILKK